MLLMETEMEKQGPTFVTIEYVAKYLGLDENVVWNMVVKEKKIKHLRTGSGRGKRMTVRIFYDDFMRYVKENTVEPKPQVEEEEEEL
jgi:hypothetical protein